VAKRTVKGNLTRVAETIIATSQILIAGEDRDKT